MTAGNYDITIEVGSTYDLKVTVKVGDPAVARDLTGYTARMHIRNKIGDAAPLLDLGPTTGLTIPAPVTGAILLNIAAAVSTSAIPLGVKVGVYDLEIVNGAVVERILEGIVTFKPEVTR